jgi:hypothetical protein
LRFVKRTSSSSVLRSLILAAGLIAARSYCTAADELDTSYQKEEAKKAAAELIKMQLKSEVFYAADVYFSESTDIVYADRVIPGAAAPKKDEQPAETKSQPSASSEKKDRKPAPSSTQSVSTQSSGGSSSGGRSSSNSNTGDTGSGDTGSDGGTTVPPADPPPVIEPPTIEPPPACPT